MTAESPSTVLLRRVAQLRDPEGVLALTDDEAAVLIQTGVSGLARHFEMSPRTLRRACAEKGTSLRGFRALLVIAGATTLLDSGLPVSDVARRLGFSSSQVFARFLRRECGATAGHLRASGSRPSKEPGYFTLSISHP